MSAADGLMPIGAFARLARLTVKAVRHYDAEGLLRPATVDPHSGYRYYRADQVQAAVTIALLRGLDLPLAAVREVLAAPDGAAVTTVLARERERLRSELAQREQVLRSIEALQRNPVRIRYDVTIADRAPQVLVGVTGPVRADALEADTERLSRRVLAATTSRRPLVAVFPLDLGDTVEVTVGLPEPDGGPDRVETPGGPWAATLHVGPYEELPLAYTAVLEHVRERGHEVRGPVTETYLADPFVTDPAELVTRVSVAMVTGPS